MVISHRMMGEWGNGGSARNSSDGRLDFWFLSYRHARCSNWARVWEKVSGPSIVLGLTSTRHTLRIRSLNLHINAL